MRSAGNAAAYGGRRGRGRWHQRLSAALAGAGHQHAHDRTRTAQLQRQAQKEGIPFTRQRRPAAEPWRHAAHADAAPASAERNTAVLLGSLEEHRRSRQRSDRRHLHHGQRRACRHEPARHGPHRLEMAKNEQDAAASPAYTAAKNSQAFVNVGPALNYLHDAAQSARAPRQRRWRRLASCSSILPRAASTPACARSAQYQTGAGRPDQRL